MVPCMCPREGPHLVNDQQLRLGQLGMVLGLDVLHRLQGGTHSRGAQRGSVVGSVAAAAEDERADGGQLAPPLPPPLLPAALAAPPGSNTKKARCHRQKDGNAEAPWPSLPLGVDLPEAKDGNAEAPGSGPSLPLEFSPAGGPGRHSPG